MRRRAAWALAVWGSTCLACSASGEADPCAELDVGASEPDPDAGVDAAVVPLPQVLASPTELVHPPVCVGHASDRSTLHLVSAARSGQLDVEVRIEGADAAHVSNVASTCTEGSSRGARAR